MFREFQYYKRLFNIYNNYRKKNITTSALPFRMWIEVHSDCNLKCVMCPNKDLDKTQRGAMDWDVFKKVIDEAKDFIFDLTLNHRGESLLHPDAVKFIKYASDRIKFTKLHTNGVFLNKDTISGIVESNLKRISFSFDGFEKEGYEKIRIGADFDEVVNNIKNLLVFRNKSKKKYPIVAIEVIELNKSQVKKEKRKKFIKEFKKLGLNELVLKKPHNWAGYISTKYKKKKYAPCTFLWNATLILWNGDVSPCSQDFFAKYIIGNVREKNIQEIWNDEPIKKLRKGLINKEYEDFPACKNCDRLWRDTFLGIPKGYIKQIILHKMP